MKIPLGIVVVAGLIWAHTAAARNDVVPSEVVASALSTEDCVTTDDQALEDSTVYELGGTTKILVLPCNVGAYQTDSIILLVDTRNPRGAKILELPDWQEEAAGPGRWGRSKDFLNVSFEARNRRLLTHRMGRGLDDCGASAQYSWTGSEFKLVGYWLKEKCDGKPFKPGGSAWRIPLPN